MTVFFALWLLKECLQTDDLGKRFCSAPEDFMKSADNRKHSLASVGKIAKTVFRILDTEASRIEKNASDKNSGGNEAGSFDFKRVLKSPTQSSDIRDRVVNAYQSLLDYDQVPTFTKVMRQTKSKGKKKNETRKSKSSR